MTESYFTEIESVEGAKQSASMGSNYSDDALVARVQKSIEEIGVAEAKQKAEEAVLDDLILSKLVQEDDPFIAMMNAMILVIPQLMKCKEELLVTKTANYDYISSLNAYMAETQQHFAYSSDKVDPTLNGSYSSGETSYTNTTTGNVHGYKAAEAYAINLSTMQTEGLLEGLGDDAKGILDEAITVSLGLKAYTPETSSWNSSFNMKEYNLQQGLWQGLNNPEWIFEGTNTSRYTNANYDYTTGKENLFGDNTKTAATYLGVELSVVLDDAVTQNTIIENTLNGYSKQIEASYKFEMENYNSIVNTDAQMYQAQLNQNNAHTRRLRAL